MALLHYYNRQYLGGKAEAEAATCFTNLFNWDTAVREIKTWPEYRPQPLHALDQSAKQLGIAGLYYKDESRRFGRDLGSFKALGAPYAVFCLIADEVERRTGLRPTSAELRTGKYQNITERVTVCVATDGNQRRGLAYGAKVFGCRCVDYIHDHVSSGRKESMEKLGAIVIRVSGEYEESVARAREDARMNGWHFVSSTSWDDYATSISRYVMNGYMILVDEALSMIPEVEKITHVLMCGGVGSIAAAIFMGFYQYSHHVYKQKTGLAAQYPRCIVIEPEEADCLYQSAISGQIMSSTGSLRTIMAGLACRTPSPAALKLLSWLASDFIVVPDAVAVEGMSALASGNAGDIPIVCGESAGASMGLMLRIANDDALRQKLGIDEQSRVVLFGCEGATDAKIYEELVGRNPDTVFEEQARYLHKESP